MAIDLRRQLAEQALRIIAGGRPSAELELTVEELMLSVDQIFAEIVKQSYYENKQNEDDFFLSGTYIYPFILDIKFDEDRKKYYAVIPTAFAGLPGNLGIQQVGSPDESYTYPVVPSNFQAMSRGLIVGGMEGRICCFSEGSKVFLLNVESSSNIEKVLIKIACGTMGSLDQPMEVPIEAQNHIVETLVNRFVAEKQLAQ